MIDLNRVTTEGLNKYSQSGEEQIVGIFCDAVLAGVESVVMCEFGAHDGSNSNLLGVWEQKGYFLVFIECDRKRYRSLAKKFSGKTALAIIQDQVGWSGSRHIDEILLRNSIAVDQVRIWSIDVDGDDIHIFRTIPETADLIIVEYNPTISFDAQFCNPPHMNIGSSPLSLCEVARDRGMFLAAMTETNLIFVSNRYSHQFRAHSLVELHPHRNSVRFAMGYDGTLIMIGGNGKNLTDEILGIGWSTAFFAQPLPRLLRKFNNLDRIKLLYCVLRLIISRPILIPTLVRKYQNRSSTKSKE